MLDFYSPTSISLPPPSWTLADFSGPLPKLVKVSVVAFTNLLLSNDWIKESPPFPAGCGSAEVRLPGLIQPPTFSKVHLYFLFSPACRQQPPNSPPPPLYRPLGLEKPELFPYASINHGQTCGGDCRPALGRCLKLTTKSLLSPCLFARTLIPPVN